MDAEPPPTEDARARHNSTVRSSSPEADSAGQPWVGRAFHDDNPFAHDTGQIPAELEAALAGFERGDQGVECVVDALRDARVLVPLVAAVGSAEPSGTAPGTDPSQELSIVSVGGPDGRRVLPIFSSTQALMAWNPGARPVPVTATRAALAAVAEGTELLVLDPTSPTEFALRRPMVWALARGDSWLPPHRDLEVRQALERVTNLEHSVFSMELIAGDPRCRLRGDELIVRLHLVAGLSDTDLQVLLTRLSQNWSADPVIVARVDRLRVELSA